MNNGITNNGGLKADFQQRLMGQIETRLKDIAGSNSPESITPEEAQQLTKDGGIDSALGCILKDLFEGYRGPIPTAEATAIFADGVHEFVNSVFDPQGFIKMSALEAFIQGGFGAQSVFMGCVARATLEHEPVEHFGA